jgi:hypothetical protein
MDNLLAEVLLIAMGAALVPASERSNPERGERSVGSSGLAFELVRFGKGYRPRMKMWKRFDWCANERVLFA